MTSLTVGSCRLGCTYYAILVKKHNKCTEQVKNPEWQVWHHNDMANPITQNSQVFPFVQVHLHLNNSLINQIYFVLN